MTKVQVPLAEIESVSQAALIAHGCEPWIAREVAIAVRTAEANNNLICGLYYLESYCLQLDSGRVDGKAQPQITRPKPAVVSVDARFGFAQAAFHLGLPEAIACVAGQGTCSLAICHSHTCTSLGFFTEQIAQQGYVGIGFTNASAVVSPPGGTKAVLGTNPIAMAVPARQGGIAFQFDQSTSAVALGKITMAAAAGQSIPEGWAVDAQGQSTTDPKAALAGSLISTGGYKGFGFGLMAEVLAAAVTGSVNSQNVKGLKLADGKPHDLGQFYLLIDPQASAGAEFFDRIEQLAQAVDEQAGCRLPGTQRVSREMVEIDGALWEQSKALA